MKEYKEMTPHINSKKSEISKIVLMPGDPLRAKYIAENFLQNAKLVNSIRNSFFYTGLYKNKKITIAASGMGMPSIGIYSYELFKFYDVNTIIRIGTCGSYTSEIKVNDIINLQSAYSESNFAKIATNISEDTISASEEIIKIISNTAKELKINIKDNIKGHCGDVFYPYDNKSYEKTFTTKNTEVVEMESFALFANAKFFNKNAGCLLTVSDSIAQESFKLSSEEREKKLKDMIKIALETCIKLK